ncbi:Trm112 family protein [Silvibacterium acidisoli]|uniref:Trm112 family protein n=1 Tax=Acidobacteriaceae bacterium ZG23-2 TaxID=2883246 RepID=UPI00406CE237
MQLPETIVCPVCFSRLAESEDKLRCLGCSRLYPIVDGLPVLLPGRATLPASQA